MQILFREFKEVFFARLPDSLSSAKERGPLLTGLESPSPVPL